MAPPPRPQVVRAPQPVVQKSAPVRTVTPANSAAMYPLRMGAGNQANLAAQAEQDGATPTAIAANDAGRRKPVRLPPLSEQTKAKMVADVERIVQILKGGRPDAADQTYLLEAVRTWERRDGEISAEARGGRRTPMLDHFLILLKSRAYSRSSFRSLWQDQYAIAFDTLWYDLRGYWLEEFKRVVRSSETQSTDGPGEKDAENGAALIAKQEAIGMWGMLKGMGTGLVSIAGPEAAQAIALQFDESARILFGHEWDAGEPLVWGMNAGQIGTAGGDVIMQLATFARAAGAKGGRILQLLSDLDKFKRAQQALAVMGGVQGVLMGVKGITQVVEAQRKTGKPVTSESLIKDPAFINHLVTLVSSGISTGLAAKGVPATPQDGLVRARIGVLLANAQVASAISEISHIAQSDASALEKELQYGQVMTGLIPLMVSVAIGAHGYGQARGEVAGQKKLAAQQKEKAAKDPGDKEAAPAKALPEPETEAPAKSVDKPEPEPDPAGKSMMAPGKPQGDAQPPPRSNREIEAARRKVADVHQAAMADEVQNRLAPRDAPGTPAEVASGQRQPLYHPDAKGSKTIGPPHASLEQARALYDQVLAETGGHFEAGIWQHPDTGEYVVRLGQATEVGPPDRVTTWRAVQHFHPNPSDIPLWRMPSGADVSELVKRVAGEGRTMTEIVEYPLPDGRRGRVAYTVTDKGELHVEYVKADGTRASKPFGKVKDFESYHSRKIGVTPDIVADVDRWLETTRKGLTADPDPGTKAAFAAAPKVAKDAVAKEKPAATAKPVETPAKTADATTTKKKADAATKKADAAKKKADEAARKAMAEEARSKAAAQTAAAKALWAESKKTPQGEEEAKRWAEMKPDPDEVAAFKDMLAKEFDASGPITSDALLQMYRHGSRETVVKYLKENLRKQAADPKSKGVLTAGDHTLTLDPSKPVDPQIDAFVKNLEGTHATPQSVMKKLDKDTQEALPGGKANPDDSLVILTPKGTHTFMDQPWKDAFDAMRKSGVPEATGQRIFDEVADGIRKTPGMSDSEKASRIARLQDEMFVELGIARDRSYKVPRIVKWWEILAAKAKAAAGRATP